MPDAAQQRREEIMRAAAPAQKKLAKYLAYSTSLSAVQAIGALSAATEKSFKSTDTDGDDAPSTEQLDASSIYALRKEQTDADRS